MQLEVDKIEFDKQKSNGKLVVSNGTEYLIVDGILLVHRNNGNAQSY
jgi:hypothetical protein